MKLKTILCVLGVLGVVSCASKSSLEDKQNSGVYSAFRNDLATYYETHNNIVKNYSNVTSFGAKAAKLSKGEIVHPINPEDVVNLPLDALPELKRARAVLMAIFARPYWSYAENPQTSAAAQFYYDCWVAQKASKYWNQESPCKFRFYNAIQLLLQNIASKENFISHADSVNSIYFAFDRDQIEQDSIPKLNMLIKQLRKVQDVELVLYGYTDRVGEKNYNRNLAQERLDAVIKVLEDSGVLNENNITVSSKAFGENDPLISPHTVINNPHSRRVDIFIISRQ